MKNKAKRLAREEQWAKDAQDRDAAAAGPKEDLRKNKGKNKDNKNKEKDKDKDSRRSGELVSIEENHGGEIIIKKEKKADRIARLAEEKRKKKEREKSEQGRDEIQDLCTAHNMHKVRSLLSQIGKHPKMYFKR